METRTHADAPAFPAAPWKLAGSAVAALRLVDCDRARRIVPDGSRMVDVWPGKTLGGLLLATYGAGSTLQYHELIVFPAIVCSDGRTGAWISHIYVDDPASMAGGREIWGLPKNLAEFHFEDDAAVVSQGSRTLWRGRWRRGGPEIPVPLWLPGWGRSGDRMLSFSARGHARASLGRIEWGVPEESPFSGVISSGAGSCLFLNRLDLTIGPVRLR